MLYCPSLRVWNLIRDERAGVWLDRSQCAPELWLVAKLPMNLIREIDAGAIIVLHAWVVENEGVVLAAFGFLVYDDPVHPQAIYGACRTTEQVEDLHAVLEMSSIPLQIHNENGLPILNATCKIAPERAVLVVDALPTGDYPAGDGVQLRRRALDIVAASLQEGAVAGPRIRANCELPIKFERKESLRVHVIGSGDFILTDTGQGKELERLTYQLLDNLFSFGTYHSPQRDHTKGRLEVCDVLALSRIREVDEEGIIVIQNKVAPAFPEGLKRTTERRGLSIQKNIIEGIDQAVGAIKKLQAGTRLYRPDGSKLEDDPPEVAAVVEPLNLRQRANQVGQGIVLVSEMQEWVDWELIWSKMVEACHETRYFFHVLDLKELQWLVVNANGRPALFEGWLVTRWVLMAKEKNAGVRFQFKA